MAAILVTSHLGASLDAPSDLHENMGSRSAVPPGFSTEEEAAAGEAPLGVFVTTSDGEYYRARVQQARRTWARGAPVVFVAAEGNLELGIEATACPDDHLLGMCCKTVAGLRLSLVRFPRARWLARGADDTYVFVRQLERELRIYQPSELIYVGAPSVSLLCHFSLHAGSCAEAHGGGGGGIVLSRPLAELFLKHSDTFLAYCRHDDIHLGHFLRYVLDVHVANLPGILQEPRIRSLAPAPEAWASTPCPSPLPSAVYSRVDDWGVTAPVVPLDVSRLVLIHSDPALWPQLDELQRAAQRLPEDVRLMVYLEARRGRVLGPHFEGRSDLSVCAYRHADRLQSFPAAADREPDAQEPLPELATLHWAAWHGRPEVAASLCAAGLDPNELRVRAPVQEEFSALHMAAFRGHLAAAEALLAARADAGCRGTLSGTTPLDMAVMAGRGGEPVARRLEAAMAAAANASAGR